LAVFALDILTDGAKWYVLLRAQAFAVPLKTVFKFQFTGFFFNNFLPSANLGGDFMRGFGLARLTERPAGAAVSVVVDRAIGLLAYMSLAVVASVVLVNVGGRGELRGLQAMAVLIAVAIVAVLGLLLSRRARAGVARVFRRRRLARLAKPWAGISSALDDYRSHPGALAAAFGIALIGIGCASLAIWLVSQAMGGEMTLAVILLFNPMIALVLMLPISFGSLGVSQAAYPFFYGLAGVTAEHAVAVSLVAQLVQLVASLPGAYFWLTNRRATQAPGEPLKESAS
jgi:uncharacterized protein (TIRG00374 family)